MSNHFSAAYLNFPDGDTRLDFTDLFAFTPDGEAGRTVLITDVNPYMHGLSATPALNMKPECHRDAVYKINIDTAGDAREAQDSEPSGDVLVTRLNVSPDPAAGPLQIDAVQLFIGVRSDTFFADAEGALHGRTLTDEVFDARNAFLTHGRSGTDGISPHGDYLPDSRISAHPTHWRTS